jgi:hypothetical protein
LFMLVRALEQSQLPDIASKLKAIRFAHALRPLLELCSGVQPAKVWHSRMKMSRSWYDSWNTESMYTTSPPAVVLIFSCVQISRKG